MAEKSKEKIASRRADEACEEAEAPATTAPGSASASGSTSSNGAPTTKVTVSNPSVDQLVDTVDVVMDTQRDPRMSRSRWSSAQAERLSRTLTAAESGDLSYADPLYADHEPDELADPLIGLVVAERYIIRERIGRGGMGIVYRVEHVRIGKVLAMKLLAGELSANKEIVRRFKLEALTVSKLSSPHTVQVFDYGVWNHLTYLVMELVEGQDLGRPLRTEGPMPFARLGRLMVQVCGSLAEAHEKGIVHRDVKPENIMIITDSRGVEIAKVLDFGLAKLRESTELNEVTLQGSVVGTPYYMSPEQVYGDEVDGRTDIYSLGAVMFRALTGTYPFDAKSPMGMFTKHLTEAPPSAVERAPELSIPQGVSDAIQKCMAKEPAERFQTIDELRDVLIDELQALPQSSSDRLLISDSSGNHDSAARAARRKRRAVVALPTDEFAKSVIATREELERYERKLRRTRYGAWTLLGLVLAGAVVGGGYVYAYRDGKVGFAGREREPNDTAADATVIPLDREVEAFLGRRLEAGKGDRDFFRFEVPEDGGGRVAVSVGSLPNMSMCSVLYRVGFTNPVAQYCTGSAGVDLEVAAVRLDPGSYLLAVSQDLTRGDDGKAPPIYENVSDSYEVRVRMATPSPTDEVEPNDDLGAPQILAAGGEVQGALAWLGDVDVFCVDAAATAPIRWQIEDGQRPRGTVLEAVAVSGDVDQPLIRVHPGGVAPEGRPHLEADVMSPWTSPSYEPRDRPNDRRCLRVTLTRDPWAETTTGPVPSTTSYRVRALLPEPEGEPPRE